MGSGACQAHRQRARLLPYREMGLKIVTAWCWWASDGPKSKEQINAPLEVTSGEACSVPFRFVQGTGRVGGRPQQGGCLPPTHPGMLHGGDAPSLLADECCMHWGGGGGVLSPGLLVCHHSPALISCPEERKDSVCVG